MRRSAYWACRLDLVAALGPRAALAYRHTSSWHARLGSASFTNIHDRIWRDAAIELGAEVIDRGDGHLEIRRGKATTRVWQHITELDDPVTLQVALDRALVHRRLAEAGIPVPEYETYGPNQVRRAAQFLEQHRGLAVVKPAAGTSGGQGITCCVRTRTDLLRATVAALPFDERVVIERQVVGAMYRLLFLDEALLGVVRRDPPNVVGDGRSNVAELIVEENRRRLSAGADHAFTLIRPDLDAVFTLRAAGMSPRSVPRAGERVQVKTATSENGPDGNVTVRRRPAASVVRDALAAAGAVGLRFAGVDIVTADVQRDLRDVGGAIVEVNGTPGLRYHYAGGDPAAADRVAVPVLSRLLDNPDRPELRAAPEQSTQATSAEDRARNRAGSASDA
jgi:D-alanine-D-alanine ligase-like ATP-grasp enzyme